MSISKIKLLLNNALLDNGEMLVSLYHFELESNIDDWKKSMEYDDLYAFVVTENQGDVAMVLLKKTGQCYVNEQAREQLKKLWMSNYEKNLKKNNTHYRKRIEQK